MNKQLPVLIILLGFGLVGCATKIIDSRNYALGCMDWDGCRHSSHPVVSRYKNIEIQSDYNLVAYPKAEAINLESGKKYHFGHSVNRTTCNQEYIEYKHCPREFVVELCEQVFGSECVLSKIGDTTIWNSSEEYLTYNVNQARIKKEYEESSRRLQQQQLQRKLDQEQEEKQRLIASLTKRCEDYGFTGDNNIAACIQREAQHDKELEMQKWELEKTRLALQQAQSRTYVQQQPEEEEVPLLIQMLGDIAVGVAEGYKNQQIYQQPQQKQSIYRNCKPNC